VVEIKAVPGQNEISILAFNGQNSIQSQLKTATFDSRRERVPSKLYVLAIGINEYVDSRQNLVFAAKDAADIASKLEIQSSTIYPAPNIHVETLLDKQASREAIMSAVKELADRMNPDDHFIVYIASHGVLMGDQYFMVTHDYDGKIDPDRNLIGSSELVAMSTSLPALNQLWIFDTCHAGGVDEDITSVYDARISILAHETGLHIFASAGSLEGALDGYK